MRKPQSISLLLGMIDPAALPSELVVHSKMRLPLTTYMQSRGERRFEFRRTPNKFPFGRCALPAIAPFVLPIASAIAIGQTSDQPLDVIVADGMRWRILGGQLVNSSAGVPNVVLREVGGGPVVFNGVVGQNAVVRFGMGLIGGNQVAGAGWESGMGVLPGNGVLLTPGRGLEIVADLASLNIDFQLFVAEEPIEITARGGA